MLKKEEVTIADLTRQAMVAAVYVVVCLLLKPLSYGDLGIEFRVAEMLMILPYFNKKYVAGVTIGCLIANVVGPFGLPDVVFGTLATFAACVLISLFKNKWLVAPVATIVNALIVGAELCLIVPITPFWFACLIVGVGEFVTVGLSVILAVFVEKNTMLSKIVRG